jgi:hypothetical protein
VEFQGNPSLPERILKTVTTRGGKTTRDPPHPNPVEKKQKEVITKSEEEEEEDTEEVAPEEEKLRKTPQDYVDTTLLPFPQRLKKPTVDEKFGKFVEVIKKINVNIPFLEAMYVPTYAKYLKDILRDLYPPQIWSSLWTNVVQPF